MPTELTTSTLPIRHIETYRGFSIWLLDGYPINFYIAVSPYNKKGLVYVDLAHLKLDIDSEESEFNFKSEQT